MADGDATGPAVLKRQPDFLNRGPDGVGSVQKVSRLSQDLALRVAGQVPECRIGLDDRMTGDCGIGDKHAGVCGGNYPRLKKGVTSFTNEGPESGSREKGAAKQEASGYIHVGLQCAASFGMRDFSRTRSRSGRGPTL